MFPSRILAGTTGVALALSAVVLSGAPAFAADADDPAFTPVAADLIGVGSDTSQHAVHVLEQAWNAQTPAPAFKVASFSATGGGNITLPSGDIARPNGSGAGKALLYGAGNNTDIDFARSSSAISATEAAAGLQAFPFALDTLAMAVSNSTPSNAPASLTGAQILAIYKGDVTNWSQIDASKSGVIAPKVPQAGSGTRSFFLAQLQALNGGTAVTLAASVAEVQEHDDTLIKNDANAIGPFSVGRAHLLGTTLRIETGWSADRALYNVVRGTDLGNAKVQAVFAEDGFVCSTAARSLIEDSGFQQLATPAHGGVCGQATQSPTSNFTLNQQVVTTTALTVTSKAAGKAFLVAAVTGSTAPDGTVTLYDGATPLVTDAPLVSGQASFTASGLAVGDHSFRAAFTPAGGSVFEASEDTTTGYVKDGASATETFPAKVAKGAKAKGTVTVTQTAGGKATGSVKVKRGTKVVGQGTLKKGKVTLTLAKLPKGKNTLKIVYAGDAHTAGSTKTFTLTQK